MTFEEIGKLTDYQLKYVLWHPRDEHGNIKLKRKERPKMTVKERFWHHFRQQGENDAAIQARWNQRGK